MASKVTLTKTPLSFYTMAIKIVNNRKTLPLDYLGDERLESLRRYIVSASSTPEFDGSTRAFAKYMTTPFTPEPKTIARRSSSAGGFGFPRHQLRSLLRVLDFRRHKSTEALLPFGLGLAADLVMTFHPDMKRVVHFYKERDDDGLSDSKPKIIRAIVSVEAFMDNIRYDLRHHWPDIYDGLILKIQPVMGDDGFRKYEFFVVFRETAVTQTGYVCTLIVDTRLNEMLLLLNWSSKWMGPYHFE